MSDLGDKAKDLKDDIKEGAEQIGKDLKEGKETVKEEIKSGIEKTNSDIKSASSDDNNKAVIMHLASIFFGVFSPLIFYFISSDASEHLKEEVRNDLNFQILMAIGAAVGIVLTATIILSLIGLLVFFAVGIANLVFEILALLKAKEGEHYKFPFTLNIIK